ncbi:MAG: hypothetical protein LQ338_000583 [Usnochroma carphineum]|nr:MAG: hypothetical protein LQ338_000583 [Usnochroma carphineum]
MERRNKGRILRHQKTLSNRVEDEIQSSANENKAWLRLTSAGISVFEFVTDGSLGELLSVGISLWQAERNASRKMTSTIGIPIKLLNEAQNHVVTLEITSGQVYRGKLIEAEDNMNVQLKDITVTARDGRVSHLDQVYIRGSHVRFFIVPDMLRYVREPPEPTSPQATIPNLRCLTR